MTWRDRSRCVTGMPAAAQAANALVTPGTTSNGTPAARQRIASSPPRPNRYGSPPLTRTTLRPASASVDEQLVDLVLRHRVVAGGLADVDELAHRRARARAARGGTRRSTSSTSATAHELERAAGDEAVVAGACADQVDGAGVRAARHRATSTSCAPTSVGEHRRELARRSSAPRRRRRARRCTDTSVPSSRPTTSR